MSDEITINDFSSGSPRFRVITEDGKTIIRDYSTNAPRFILNGEIGGDTVKTMTTAERTAITPEAGQLIFDTTLGILFVGNGATPGGTAVGGGEDDVPGYRLDSDGEFLNFNPISDIINVTGSTVTLEPDKAYKIVTTNGAVNITANPPAANKWGYEGHAEIFVGATGYAVFDTSKIVLANQLEPDSVNNCTLRFHDGMCYVSVEDHVAGYIVVNGSTSGEGSLYYGITTSTNDYVAFDASLNGTTIDLGGSTASAEKHLVGNGYNETILTGNVNCGASKFTVANLSLQNVTVTGGTLTLGDAFIPSGSTVAVSGGGLAVEKVSGNGGVIDLGNTHIVGGGSANGVTITNGGTSDYGGAWLTSNMSASFTNCVFTNNIGPTGIDGAAIRATNATSITGCTFSNNTGRGAVGIAFGGAAEIVSCLITDNPAGGVYIPYAPVNMTSCVITSNGNTGVLIYQPGSACTMTDCIVTGNTPHDISTNRELKLYGTNKIGRVNSGGTGTITLTSGAILDLTGNTNATPIALGGVITLDASPSSGVVIIGSAGSGTQARTFAGGGTITGSAITNTGAISGATVTLPSSSCQIEFVKSGETVVSSAFIQASDTPYVLETQQGAGAVLVRAIED